MAIKVINVQQEKEKETKETLKCEVELLPKISHVSLNYLVYSRHWLTIRYSRTLLNIYTRS
jgi:hypothetical protein